MSPSMRAYKGLASPEATADMLLYLDALDRQAATGASSAAVAR